VTPGGGGRSQAGIGLLPVVWMVWMVWMVRMERGVLARGPFGNSICMSMSYCLLLQRREVLGQWRRGGRRSARWAGNVSKCDCAFDLFPCKDNLVLPAHKDADVAVSVAVAIAVGIVIVGAVDVGRHGWLAFQVFPVWNW